MYNTLNTADTLNTLTLMFPWLQSNDFILTNLSICDTLFEIFSLESKHCDERECLVLLPAVPHYPKRSTHTQNTFEKKKGCLNEYATTQTIQRRTILLPPIPKGDWKTIEYFQ